MGDLSPEYVRELLIRFSLEAAFITALMVVAWRRLGWNRVFTALGRGPRVVAIGFVAALTVVQLVDRWQYEFPPRFSFYPLARFAMYQTGTIGEEGILTYRFMVTTAEGEAEVDVTERFGAIGLPSLNTRFRVISERLISGDAEDRAWAEAEIDGFGRGLAERARAHGESAIETVAFEVWRYSVGTTRPEDGVRLDRVQIPVRAP